MYSAKNQHGAIEPISPLGEVFSSYSVLIGSERTFGKTPPSFKYIKLNFTNMTQSVFNDKSICKETFPDKIFPFFNMPNASNVITYEDKLLKIITLVVNILFFFNTNEKAASLTLTLRIANIHVKKNASGVDEAQFDYSFYSRSHSYSINSQMQHLLGTHVGASGMAAKIFIDRKSLYVVPSNAICAAHLENHANTLNIFGICNNDSNLYKPNQESTHLQALAIDFINKQWTQTDNAPRPPKLSDWIQKLPELKLLKDSEGKFIPVEDAFKREDIIFGKNTTGAVIGYYARYFQNNTKLDFPNQTYRKWFGNWIGYSPTKGLKYDPELAQTPAELQFLNAIRGSRYNFETRQCTDIALVETKDRITKASKAFLEFVLFHQDVRKIHFVLDTFYEPAVRYNDNMFGEKKLIKDPTYTGHELRHLHRLAVVYPSEVAEKVICWLNNEQVQLPATTDPIGWSIWETRLDKITTGAPVRRNCRL